MEPKVFATLFLACLYCVSVRSATHDVLTLCADKGWADGIYPHPTNCSMFIECSGQVTSELDCPANLVFNPNLNVCDDPGNVVGGMNCAQTTATPAQTTTTPTVTQTTTQPMTTTTSKMTNATTTAPPTTTTAPPTTSTVPTTTTTTTASTTTTTIPTTTTTTTPTTTTTTMATTATTTTTTTTPTTTTTTPTTTTTTPTTTTTTPTTTTTTPTTTTTTPTTTTTMPPTTTTTTTTTTPPTTTPGKPTPSTIDITNLCFDENLRNGIHPDPTSCIHFIECTFGRTYRMDCPIGLAFNSKALTCDDRFNVDCGLNYNYIIG